MEQAATEQDQKDPGQGHKRARAVRDREGEGRIPGSNTGESSISQNGHDVEDADENDERGGDLS